MADGAQKSLVLITVDCLRADHVGFLGYDGATTPFLDSLAQESCVFPSAIVAGAPTYYSFPAILASRHPLALGRDQVGLAPGEPSLATALKAAGYATAAFCAGNPYLSHRFGYDQGFDKFDDYLGSEIGPLPDNAAAVAANGRWATRLNHALETISHRLGSLGPAYDELYFQYCQRWATPSDKSLDELRRFPAADVLVNDALAWLASLNDEPFFLWLHFMDPHSPYYPSPAALDATTQKSMTAFRARYLNSFWSRGDLSARRLLRHRDEIVSLYDAGVRWVDAQIERLVNALRQSKRWQQCALAFTADHGEEFLDHGGRYHPPNDLKEELIRVPLLLRVAGDQLKKIFGGPFSLLHLAPTLMDALGLSVPEEFRGRSYWKHFESDAACDSPAIVECVSGCTNPFAQDSRLHSRVLAVREGQYKLILRFAPPAEQLFDLVADPREQNPLGADAERPVRRRLLEAARDHLRRSAGERDPQVRLRACLRELQLEWAASVLTKPTIAS
jgi:arylsulfatase A-like enzyme